MAIDQILVPSTNDQLHGHTNTDHTAVTALLVTLLLPFPSPGLAIACPNCFCEASPNLSGDCDLIQVLILHRPIGLVCVVEHYGHCRLGHPSLPLFVDQLLQAVGPHLARMQKPLSRCRLNLKVLTHVSLAEAEKSVSLSRMRKLFDIDKQTT